MLFALALLVRKKGGSCSFFASEASKKYRIPIFVMYLEFTHYTIIAGYKPYTYTVSVLQNLTASCVTCEHPKRAGY
jgi:hypothetical protein